MAPLNYPKGILVALLAVLLAIVAAGCVNSPVATPIPSPTSFMPVRDSATPVPPSTPTPTPTPTLTPTPTITPTPIPAVLVGAGDIAICGQEGHGQTAALLDQVFANGPAEIFTAGDNSNESGKMAQYTRCFAPAWGRYLAHIHPAPGNHDYNTDGGADYFQYFGPAAGQPGQGFYSYDVGSWHVVALNSNCDFVACGEDSQQVAWLKADLAAHPAKCTLAYWHHPRWSSGVVGNSGQTRFFYQALYEAGAEIVIGGHEHEYERFAPQNPDAQADPNGIRQFVVGTGGAGIREFKEISPNSEVHHTGTFGVLKLNLYPEHYDWEFLPVAGQTFTDSGSSPCH